MKNKTLQRVLSFCLALILCFTWNIAEPLVANAFAIELGWVTYALISFLIASGFTFSIAGGIEALQSAVEEKVDTYYEVTSIDLYQLIAQSIQLSSPNNNGGKPGLWFTAAAVAAIVEFVEWLKANGWAEGEEVTSVISDRFITAVQYKNGSKENIAIKNTSYKSFDGAKTSEHFQAVSLGDVFSKEEINYVRTNGVITNGITFVKSSTEWWGWTFGTNYSGKIVAVRIQNGGVYGAEINIYQYIENAGYTESNVVGFTFSHEYQDQSILSVCYLLAVMDDGTLVRCNSVSSDRNNCISLTESATISIPDTITEFEVDENKVVVINFDVFSDADNITSPEELGEAVKQQIIDTGTVPEVITDVVTLPEPAPSPVVPAPEAPPVYGDVEDLGLPLLGEVLMQKFPFCLVSDFGRVVKVFTAERQTPKWEVDLYEPLHGRIPMQGDTKLSIDLTEYEDLGRISRWITTLGFCLMLILITKQMISW